MHWVSSFIFRETFIYFVYTVHFSFRISDCSSGDKFEVVELFLRTVPSHYSCLPVFVTQRIIFFFSPSNHFGCMNIFSVTVVLYFILVVNIILTNIFCPVNLPQPLLFLVQYNNNYQTRIVLSHISKNPCQARVRWTHIWASLYWAIQGFLK